MSDQNSDPSRPFDPPAPPTQPPTAPPASPEAPPAPPVTPPPAPGLPPVPQYGEYAPEGYVSPAAAAPAANPYGVPGYTAPAAPAYGGVPTYGTVPVPAYAPPVRKRRTWDTVLTIILLVLGFFGLVLAIGYAAIFASPQLLNDTLAQQGITGSIDPGSAPAIILISHVVLYLLALGLSIPLLVRGRIVVFWIPLTIGVVAAIIFWVTLTIVFTSDPSFLSHYGA